MLTVSQSSSDPATEGVLVSLFMVDPGEGASYHEIIRMYRPRSRPFDRATRL